MTIKPTYLVTDMDFQVDYDKQTGEPREVKTEAKAIQNAKDLLKSNAQSEVWVWRLSHVVSRPDAEPDVEKVKP